MAKGNRTNELKKYKVRVGHTSGMMREALPKPNVVRIQVLDGPARRSFMGGFHSTLDEFRTTMQDAVAAASHYNMYEPFYGILDSSEGQGPSLNVSAKWAAQNATKSGFAMMNTLLTSEGQGGIVGLLPFIGGNLSDKINTALGTIDKVATTSMGFAGMNNYATGSTTIKQFTGTTIDANMPLKFKWYLPEQEQMCRISIKRLITMAYVRPMDMDAATIANGIINAVVQTGSSVYDAVTGSITGSYNEGTSSQNRGKQASSNKEESAGHDSMLGKWAKNAVKYGVNVYNSINSYFGGEITANPLPVRISIGHYLDIEPVVITDVRITASREQFISKDGTHLPIWVEAEVKFDYWMQPGPTKDFMSFLGSEVFDEWVRRDPKTDKNQKAGGLAGAKK